MTTTCGRSPPLSGRSPAVSARRHSSTSASARRRAGAARVGSVRRGRPGPGERVEGGADGGGAGRVEPATQPRPALPVRGQGELHPPRGPLLRPGQRIPVPGVRRRPGRPRSAAAGPAGPAPSGRTPGRARPGRPPHPPAAADPRGSSPTVRVITAACGSPIVPSAHAAAVASNPARSPRAVCTYDAASDGEIRSRPRSHTCELGAPSPSSTPRASASPTRPSSTACARATTAPASTTSETSSASSTDHNGRSATSASNDPTAANAPPTVGGRSTVTVIPTR